VGDNKCLFEVDGTRRSGFTIANQATLPQDTLGNAWKGIFCGNILVNRYYKKYFSCT